MTGNVLAKRYAGALIDLCMEQNIHEKVVEQLGRFTDVVEGSDLKKVFLDPSCAVEEKMAIMGAVAGRLKIEGVLNNFLSLLVEKKRMGYLKHINEAFRSLLDEKVGRVSAEVVIPYAPDNREIEDIRKGLERSTGKDVVMEVRVDPKLIGGVISKVGSIVYDGSLKTQLENIKNTIVRG